MCVGVTVWFGWVVWYPYAGCSTAAACIRILKEFKNRRLHNKDTPYLMSVMQQTYYRRRKKGNEKLKKKC